MVFKKYYHCLKFFKIFFSSYSYYKTFNYKCFYETGPISQSHKNASRLHPGEVGLCGDRAAIEMRHADRSAPVPENGQPTGAVYYNMRPESMVQWPGKPDSKIQHQRRHVMQVLPPVPILTEPAVGPVTGLPIDDNEHVFVFRLGKREDEPDEMARLQIEMRLPKRKPVDRKNTSTQFLVTDVHTTGGSNKNKNNAKDKKKDSKKSKSKKSQKAKK